MKPAARRKARSKLMQAMYQWQITETELRDLERQFLLHMDPKKVDTDYFVHVLHALPKMVGTLDAAIEPHVTREIDPIERAILRLGVYELQAQLEIPYRVVINEAVELSKTFGAVDSHKFINSILDRVAAEARAVEIKGESKT